jgi:hypothetical protein
MNHEVARSARVELHGRYHIADLQLSRFGNITGRKHVERLNGKHLLASRPKFHLSRLG